MRRTILRVIALTQLLLLVAAPALWADCATYISGMYDNATTGYLIGEGSQTLTTYTTTTTTTTINASSGFNLAVGSFNGGGSYSVTQTTNTQQSITFDVGTYDMDDGGRILVSCLTYQQI